MRRLLVVLMALGLLAYAPVGALAQGYALVLGIQGRVQVTTNSSWFQNLLALSDEELSDVSGGQLFADVESYIFGCLSATWKCSLELTWVVDLEARRDLPLERSM